MCYGIENKIQGISSSILSEMSSEVPKNHVESKLDMIYNGRRDHKQEKE